MQAEAEKPEQSRQKKKCLAMKKLDFEQMAKIEGGSMRAILLCAAIGAMYSLANPVAGIVAGVACSILAQHEES